MSFKYNLLTVARGTVTVALCPAAAANPTVHRTLRDKAAQSG
jgi:hypothetical protein